MSETVVTIRDVFELPQPGSPAESSPRWQTLRQWISEDLKGMKAGAMPDVAAKIADLLEVPIAEIFLASWNKADAVKQLLEESRKTPDALVNVGLAEHSINSKHQPHIEISAKNAAVKKIEFTLQLLFKLKDFQLRIQNGEMKEMHTGPCHVRGTLQYQGLAIAEKELAPIKLPATVTLESSSKTEEKPAPENAPSTVSSENLAEKVTPLEPPKPAAPVTERAAAAAGTTLTQEPAAAPIEAYKLKPPVKITTINEPVRVPDTLDVSEGVPGEAAPSEEKEEREVFVL